MLNSIDSLTTTVDLGPLQPLLDQLLGGLVEFVEVADFFESEEDGVTSYTLILGVKQSALFPLPGLDAIQLGIVRDSDDEMPLILGELVVSGAPLRVAIRHFPLRVVIDNPLLLPVSIDDDVAVLDGFSFEIEGAFSVAADLTIRAELESFSLPPFTIDGTGLLLGLDECRLVTHADDVDDERDRKEGQCRVHQRADFNGTGFRKIRGQQRRQGVCGRRRGTRRVHRGQRGRARPRRGRGDHRQDGRPRVRPETT